MTKQENKPLRKCPKHPKYKAHRKPMVDCQECWEIYRDRVFGDLLELGEDDDNGKDKALESS